MPILRRFRDDDIGPTATDVGALPRVLRREHHDGAGAEAQPPQSIEIGEAIPRLGERSQLQVALSRTRRERVEVHEADDILRVPRRERRDEQPAER